MAHGGRKTASSAFVAAIVTGSTVEAAANTAGVSQRTAYRWLSDEETARQITEARARLIDQAAGRLADAATEAANTLRALLDARSETVRLHAARSLLEIAFRARELIEFESRLSTMEEIERERKGQTDKA